jgi:EmrB/QacA subfamily drug resistance transporter
MTHKWWALVAVCTGVFMLLIDITIVNVALPSIERDFHASLSDLEWVVSAYALTLAAFLLTGGSLADRFGRRRLYAIGIVWFTFFSILCGVATGPLFLNLCRAAQGVGGAIMFATSLAILADAFRGRDRGVAFGIFGAITGVAVAVGPVVGGALTSGLSWRWIFFVNVPIGAFALVITILRVRESRDPAARRIDLPGFASFSVALAALVYGLVLSSTDGWSSPLVDASLGAAFALLAAFIAIELRSVQPMLDMSLLRVPTFNGGLIAAFAISAGLFSLLTYLTIYFQNILGMSAIATGVRFLPLTGAMFVTAGLAGRLTTHVARKWLIAVGFLAVGAGVLLMRGLTAQSSWTHLMIGFVVAGAGAGFVNVPLISTAVGVVTPERSGMASGINSTLRQAGIATGVAGLGTIFTAQVGSSIAAHLSGSALAGRATAISKALANGSLAHVIASAPPALQGAVVGAARGGFVDGLNTIFLVAALTSFAAAALSLALVRESDFVEEHFAQEHHAAPIDETGPVAAPAWSESVTAPG